MQLKLQTLRLAAAALLLTAFVVTAPTAQDEPPATGWADTAEFALVSTGGNSESVTFGFKNIATRRWEKAAMEIKAGAIRAESKSITRICVGANAATCDTQEIKNSEVSADQYYLNGRYGQEISSKLFWYAGLGWQRNRPAGVENRYLVEGGVGNIWRNTDDLKFRSDYGLTYTDEESGASGGAFDSNWLGFRASYTYMNKLTETTTFDSNLILDENLDDPSDWRADFTNSVSVAMSKTLALKASLQILYDNVPAYQDGELFTPVTPGDPPTATDTLVPVQMDKTDTIFTASLVINF